MRKFVLALAGVLCLCLLGACASDPPPQGADSQEEAREDFTAVPPDTQAAARPLPYRAMWVSYLEWQLFNPFDLDAFTAAVGAVMDNCVALGLNAVIVQVRPFSDAIYPSGIYPWSHLVSAQQGVDPGYDPLQIFIEQAHARGLVIEAWINPYRIRLSDSVPEGALSETHPAVLHPEWVREASGGLYYDPALPEVQDMVVNGVLEIVHHYAVDGIQFDDYFYPTTDPEFDADSYARYGEGRGLAEWRRENVNTLVRRVYGAIKEARPEVAFGISPQGNNDNNYGQQYSDVALWMSEPGYVDYIMPQVYWGYDYTMQSGSRRFAFANIVSEWLAMPRDRSVSLAFGLGAYRIGEGDGSAVRSGEWSSGHNLADMTRTLGELGADGYGIYRYACLYDTGNYAALLHEERAALAEANGRPAM